ncbi:MAG: hypothetical protein VX549_14330 [Pseudomonadota bacterium]|nr:hypothetical protein [Pseudomonadota bacterium]
MSHDQRVKPSGNARRALLSGAMLSLIDQAMLSATNFGIGLLFIRLASKSDYGLYAQFFGVLMLSQALQNAISNAPLVSLGPKLRGRRQRSLAAHLLRFQSLVSAAAGVAAIAVVSLLSGILSIAELTPMVGCSFAVALVGQWLREYARNFHFCIYRPGMALTTDAVYSVGVIAGLLTIASLDQFGTSTVLLTLGAASIVSGLIGLVLSGPKPLGMHGRAKPALARAWHVSRWTLPSVLLSWVSNNTFAFVVAIIIGLAASADISAARLLLMPAGLCLTAWTKVFAPRMSSWWGLGARDTIRSATVYSCVALLALILTYTVVLLLAFPLLEQFLLGERYSSAAALIPLWALFFSVNAVRGVGTAVLVGAERFKDLFVFGLIGAAVSLLGSVAGTIIWGTGGAVLGLALGELCLLLLIATIGRRRIVASTP